MARLAALLVLLFATAASAAAPTVLLVTPTDASTDVSTAIRVHVLFDQQLDEATVTTSTAQILLSGVPITAAAIWRTAAQSITIRPLGQLATSTTYTVKIVGGGSGVKNGGGEALASDFTSTFTTAATYSGGTYIFENVVIGPNVSID